MIFEFKMPKMGESISEATVISWTKSPGDYISAEETFVEVATDKVDNDVLSPVSGKVMELRFAKDDIVKSRRSAGAYRHGGSRGITGRKGGCWAESQFRSGYRYPNGHQFKTEDGNQP